MRKEPSSRTLSIEWLEHINRACLDFEAAWKRGDKPRIEDYLGGTKGEERSQCLYELLVLELGYRRHHGESPSPAEYRARFPDDGVAVDDAFTEGGLGLPRKIGKYYVITKLGGGGQADVYRALHAGLDRELVVKVSRESGGMDRACAERFLNEGKVLAELQHPNLARVYDVDFFEDRPFLAMGYIRGHTLEQELRAQRPLPRKTTALIAKVARALDAAHRRGVIHRDIKPENIIIDERGEPRVIDFGLARREDAWRSQNMEPGGVAGTAPFIPVRSNNCAVPQSVQLLGVEHLQACQSGPTMSG